MIVVDTSVWVAALRSGEGAPAFHLRHLLDDDLVALPAPVRVEILAGASASHRVRLRRSLSALPILYPDESTWQRIDLWLEKAAAAGERFGAMDLLIGAITADHDSELWSLDEDFTRLSRLGLVKLHREG